MTDVSGIESAIESHGDQVEREIERLRETLEDAVLALISVVPGVPSSEAREAGKRALARIVARAERREQALAPTLPNKREGDK
jgi:hypothetical protein